MEDPEAFGVNQFSVARVIGLTEDGVSEFLNLGFDTDYGEYVFSLSFEDVATLSRFLYDKVVEFNPDLLVLEPEDENAEEL